MKKNYQTPALMEYGRLDHLTLGSSSTLPDIDQNGNAVGVGCTGETFTIGGHVYHRTGCNVVIDS
jgi:hypothetical protein